MKCYKKLFTKKGIINNFGFYIMTTIIIITLILCILFKIKGYDKLKIIIDKIIENKKREGKKQYINKKEIKSNPPKIKIKKRKLKKLKINMLKTNDELNNISKIELKNSKGNIKEKEILINNNILKNNIVKNYNDYELNTLSYNEAIKLDKRTFFQYYFSLLKTKHILIFSFYTNSDYNSKSIKIILFLFSFSLYFVINALFFTDTTIHKINAVDQGKFNIIYQMPKIIYSTIITSIINVIIKYFSLTEKNIVDIKKEKNNIIEERNKILKCLTIKFIIFFILIFLFLILFWYFLSCFCTIYCNSQIHLIKDTLISFGLSLLYPFGLNILPGLFRISSLANKNKEYLFKLGLIIQFII